MQNIMTKHRLCTVLFFRGLVGLLLLSSVLTILGCKDKESYMKEMELKGIKYSRDSFMNEVQAGNKENVDLFIKAGINVNDRVDNGYTALMVASMKGHLDIAKLLIEKGADVNTKDNNGGTALMVASSEGHLDIANLLIEKGADVNTKSSKGITALRVALFYEKTQVANLLRKAGARQ
jgi:ankyrin repeat protein